MQEVWKDVKGYEGSFQVSNFGNVRSCDRYIKSSHGTPMFKKGKMKKLFESGRGYYQVAFRVNGIHKTKTVHRLIAETFVLNPENKPQVNHIDGNKKNNHVSNLEWVTASENCKHAHDNNLASSIKGEYHKNSKLKRSQVVEIYRKYHNENTTMNKLASEYNVSYTTIRNIVRGITWDCVTCHM